MSRRTASVLAWGLLTSFVAMSGFTTVELVRGRPSDEWVTLLAAGYAVVGALIASRRPQNRVGWLLLGISVVLAFGGAAESWIAVADRPGRAWVGWVASSCSDVWLLLAGAVLPMVFPTGRLLSRRWRPAAWLTMVALCVSVLASALRPGRMDLESPLENPLGIAGAAPFLDAASTAGGVATGVAFVLAAASLVVRFRQASGGERQQLKWFVLVGLVVGSALLMALVGVLLPGTATALLGAVGWFTFVFTSLIGIPVAVGIAILRYRLLDIDLVINRTLVYGALTAVLAAAYLSGVLLLQLLLSPLTESSDLAVAVSTLVVAGLFRPLRSRVQRLVDRRFYRRRYDGQRTVRAFAGRLRSELDLTAVGDDLRAVVTNTVQPTHVRLWLRGSP